MNEQLIVHIKYIDRQLDPLGRYYLNTIVSFIIVQSEMLKNFMNDAELQELMTQTYDNVQKDMKEAGL